jgi:hypothetical protein
MPRVLIGIGFALLVWLMWPSGTPHEPMLDGVLEVPEFFAPDLSIDRPPIQTGLDAAVGAVQLGDFVLTPVARFEIEARVLSRREYTRGVEAEVSPVDLALGWGPMADPDVLAKISIRQSNRFYYWSTRELPIPRREIETNSANMHMIPADVWAAEALAAVRPDQTVRIAGYLVNVERRDGWRWRTSLTRHDTGHGACEIVLVQRIEAS